MSGRGQGWTLRALLADAVARFREGAAALPARAWRAWLAAIAAGFAFLLLLMTGMVHAGQSLADNGLLGWERAFLIALETALPLSFSSAVWIQTLGTDITLVFLVLLAGGLATWGYHPIHALSIVAAYAGVDLVVRFGWLLWNRARPDVILDGVAAPGFASFPSGHTAKSLAVYGLLAFFWARATSSRGERVLAAVLAAIALMLVTIGRLRMGVHWPSDIVAGALIGAVWLGVVAAALVRAERTLPVDEEAGAAEPARG